jgi:autotransporter-associated beta strand protein
MVLLMAGVNGAWAADYTNTAAGNWSAAIWSPAGLPGAADSAFFTGAANRTVSIAVGNQAINAINVTGTAVWLWDALTLPSHNTLTLGAGNLNYNGSNTLATLSSFNAILAGSGGVRMNSGVLRIGDRNVHSNSFSGGIEINGGILLNGGAQGEWEAANTRDLGSGGIIIGSATPGSNNATLLIGGGNAAANFVTNAITIRAGNDGVARLGTWANYPGSAALYSYLTGPVTMAKDLTLVNDGEQNKITQTWDAFVRESCSFLLYGGVGGSGNLTKEGLGVIQIMGVSSYTGTTTIRGGTTYILGTNNSNVGNFTVEYGALIIATNPSLGAVGNTLTLGGNGTFGAFGTVPYTGSGNYPLVPITRPITLAGNGGS